MTQAIVAAKKAILALIQHYNSVPATPSERNDTFSFPYRTHYTSGKERVEFRYHERLYDTKLVFLAKTTQNKDVCVKFTRKYSVAAHERCAENFVAPRLLADETLPGGWIMVVMEYLDEALYEHFGNSNRHQLQERVARAIEILHTGEFVHGDVRDVNVMIRKEFNESDQDPGVMLLDFDWAGKVNEAHYPPHVNTQIFRPPGAEDNLPITKAHDLAMLDYMFGSASFE